MEQTGVKKIILPGMAPFHVRGTLYGHAGNPFTVLMFVNADQTQCLSQGAYRLVQVDIYRRAIL